MFHRYAAGSSHTVVLVFATANAGLLIKCLYLYFGVKGLPGRFFSSQFWKTRMRFSRFALVAATLAGIVIVSRVLSSNDAAFSENMIQGNARYFFLEGILHPGKFIVMHAVYFGPLFCFALFCWRPVCRAMHELGPGFVLSIIPGIVLSTSSESRFLMMYYPLFLICVAKALSAIAWDARKIVVLLLLALGMSKIWLPIRVPAYSDVLGKFPEQLLFMNQGPKVITSMYILQGIIVACIFCFIYFYFVRSNRIRKQGDTDNTAGTHGGMAVVTAKAKKVY
jgi:hypothetical protein